MSTMSPSSAARCAGGHFRGNYEMTFSERVDREPAGHERGRGEASRDHGHGRHVDGEAAR